VTVKELISYLREGIRVGEWDDDTPVFIYDCHDIEADGTELEAEHIVLEEDEDDFPLLFISNQED